ncbi:YigZ family protein [Pontibacter sp. G13]|uniref:IMPACT family protein n=1 Tax=Pontibacter sp. G13 TaxID=3074898 RepID=UPI00288B3821|nr:YigZ family protein [Pontibacter sp. G13]WNJ19832.1 YigZ family protein [Pontibacter sp. G13]
MGHLHYIEQETTGFLKDRGSKFHAFAYPVKDLADIEKRVQALKKEFHDARHHCYAYRLGMRGETTYATDDGEPSHSAGTPILAAIRSFEVTDALVVVVRYFGGTKLGVRGLIEAYRTSAELALEENPRTAIIPKVIFSIQYPYEKTSDINRILHRHDTEVVEAAYTEMCKQTLSIKVEEFPPLKQAFEQSGYHLEVLEEQ